MKKIMNVLLGVLAVTLVFSACSKKDATPMAKKSVTFWYNYKGDEAAAFEKVIAQYNAMQDTYTVTGLSVTDQQKLIVALASNEAPDAFTLSCQDVINFQNNGLLQALEKYISAENFDIHIFSDKSLEANTANKKLYALPLSGYTIQMFYNKDILKEIGYSQPPATMEEMYEMAVKATQTDANGNITRLGYPLFPLASARQELIYGFGGRWWANDGVTLTPQDPLVIESLKMNVRYRKLYGIEKVQAFVATANTNRYTAQDMFFSGKQLFRLDGSWLPTMMKNFNSTVDYGIALIPGTKANPESQGVSRYETTSIALPVTSSNTAGAWDFMKYISGMKGNKTLLEGIGNLPALKELYSDPDLLAKPGFPEFIDALELEKGIQFPQIADFAKYVSLINEHLDYVYNGMQTPEQAMANLAKQSANLK